MSDYSKEESDEHNMPGGSPDELYTSRELYVHIATRARKEEWTKRKGTGGSLGKFYKSRERHIHISARARMITNPLNPNGPLIPWVQRPGRTYRKATT